MNDPHDEDLITNLKWGQLKAMIAAEVERREAKPESEGSAYLKLADAAHHYRVTPRTMDNWLARGAPHRKVGPGRGGKRVCIEELDAWFAEQHKTRELSKAG